jgi:ABC-type lipoprotein release transport system permease subunit
MAVRVPRELAIVGSWLRLDLPRRRRSLAALVLLIAVAGGTVMTAAAGARRGETASHRLWSAGTLPATAAVLPNQRGFDWDAVARMPGVEAVGTFCGTFLLDGIPESADVGFAGCDANLMSTLERPVAIRGRLPDPHRVDEALVSQRFVDENGLDVGDTVTARLFSLQQIKAAETSAELPKTAEGPSVRMRIVGVGRSPWYHDGVEQPGGLAASAALGLTYPDHLMADFANALVRLKDGEAGLPSFEAGLAEVTGRNDIDVWNLTAVARHERKLTAFEARCLLAFAGAALLAALVLIGQAIVRFTTAALADLGVLRTLGMSRTQTMMCAVTGPALAAVVGAVVGGLGSVLVSRWFPIGTAAASEPAPGLDADPLVLLVGALGVPLLVLAGAAAAAGLGLASMTGRTRAARRSSIAATAARAGLPVPIVVGARFALEPGRGRGAVPVRSALAGAVVGVLGVVGALTFADAVTDAGTNPRRFGQTHALEATLGYGGRDFVPAAQVLDAVAQVPGTTGVNDTRFAVAKAGRNSVPVTVHSYAPVNRPLDVVVTEGRLPRAPDEVVLAPETTRLLQVSTGDALRFLGSRQDRELTVTGIGFVPITFHNGYATGGWMTRDGYADLFTSDKGHSVMVSVNPGELEAVRTRIDQALAEVPTTQDVQFQVPEPPAQLAEIRQVQRLPLVLGGFLAALAVGAVGHALSTAVRRRRHDVSVLRALGLTRKQARGLVATQASVLALVGLLFGIPIGLALGRTTWRLVADYTPLQYVPPLAFWAMLLVGPLSLAVANLLAAWPGRQAARLRIGHVLRAE